MEHIKAGTLRGLAVTTTARSPGLPDVPSLNECVSGYEASGWNGILASKNTPLDIIPKLNAVINAGLADPRSRHDWPTSAPRRLPARRPPSESSSPMKPKSGRGSSAPPTSKRGELPIAPAELTAHCEAEQGGSPKKLCLRDTTACAVGYPTHIQT